MADSKLARYMQSARRPVADDVGLVRQRGYDLWRDASVPMAVLDTAGFIVEANNTFAVLLGFRQAAELTGAVLQELPPNDDSEAAHGLRPRVLQLDDRAGIERLLQRPTRLLGRRGDEVWCRLTAREISLTTGEEGSSPWGRVADFVELVAEPMRRELALESRLRAQEALYYSLVDAISEAILIVDFEGRVVAANGHCERLFGWSLAEVHGRFLPGFLVPVDGSWSGDHWFRQVEGGEVLAFDLPTGRKWAFVRGVTVRVPGGKEDDRQVLLSFADRTADQKARQTESWASLQGRLNAGLSHDLRNLLTAILGGADLIRATSGEAESRSYGGQIANAAQAAETLLTQAVLVARRGRIATWSPVELDSGIEGVRELLVSILGRSTDLEVRLNAPAALIAARGALEPILVNLILNARDALKATRSSRRVVIESSWVDQAPERIEAGSLGAVSVSSAGPARRVCLRVRDTGPGFPPEIIASNFEAFVTTHGETGGTGLGISGVAWLASQLGGTCHVENWVADEAGVPAESGGQVTLILPASLAPGHVL